jgi:transcriptional regulator with XRE-family HTH domain
MSDRGQEVASLLRSRRERLQPADVGLPGGVRRRAPGLRREEVAQLASVSVTYYTFLEQGRDVRPSRPVLDALADALRMTPAERGLLHDLVHGEPPAGGSPEKLPAALAGLVDRLDPHPAYVKGRRWDILAANRAARLLWTDWAARPPAERNMVWWTFLDPAARSVLVEWEAEASEMLARFRAACARHAGDPAFAELTGRLLDGSPEARAWWPRHEVAPVSSGMKRLRHPALGEMTLAHVVLQLADDPEQKLVSFSATPDDEPRIAALLDPPPPSLP